MAITLLLLLWSWLAGTGMFDASLATHIGGPYGLTAFLTALALAAGARLADAIIPVRDIWPAREKHFHRAVWGLCALGALAYLGLPGATLLTDIAIVPGSARGRRLSVLLRPARHQGGAGDRAQRRGLRAGGAGGGRDRRWAGWAKA